MLYSKKRPFTQWRSTITAIVSPQSVVISYCFYVILTYFLLLIINGTFADVLCDARISADADNVKAVGYSSEDGLAERRCIDDNDIFNRTVWGGFNLIADVIRSIGRDCQRL